MAIDAVTVIVPLAASIVGGLIVAFANHWLTSSRERSKRLAELTIQRRIEAYKRLERGSQIGSMAQENEQLEKLMADFESAYAETILLGTRREIELAHQMAEHRSFQNSSDGLIPLLDEIRDNLRRDLRLEKNKLSDAPFFRFRRDD